jgi:hypothetical protein
MSIVVKIPTKELKDLNPDEIEEAIWFGLTLLLEKEP